MSAEQFPSASGEQPPVYTFQAQIGPNDPQGVEALQAVLTAWTVGAPGRTVNIQQNRPANPPAEQFDLNKLSEISLEHWGVPWYGETAAGLLTAEQQRLHTGVYYTQGSRHAYTPSFHPRRRDGGMIPGVTTADSIDEISAAARDWLISRGTPAEFVIIPALERKAGMMVQLLHISPGNITTTAVARYVQARNYPNHRLPGSLGRTIDTICLAIGALKEPRVPAPPPDTEKPEYITEAELLAGITPTVSRSARDSLQIRTRRILTEQLLTGGPIDGETQMLIAEGPCKVDNKPNTDFESFYVMPAALASRSLAVVRRQFKSGQRTNTTTYLESLIAAAS